MASSDSLRIDLRPPWSLLAFACAVHLLAAILLCSVQPHWLGWVGVPLVLISAGYELHRIVRAPRALRYEAAGWSLDGGWHGELLDAPCASRWLVVLRLHARADGSRRWFICAADQIIEADVRRLLRQLSSRRELRC